MQRGDLLLCTYVEYCPGLEANGERNNQGANCSGATYDYKAPILWRAADPSQAPTIKPSKIEKKRLFTTMRGADAAVIMLSTTGPDKVQLLQVTKDNCGGDPQETCEEIISLLQPTVNNLPEEGSVKSLNVDQITDLRSLARQHRDNFDRKP